MEIWKDIKGYEGLYQVSSFGRVKSLQGRGAKERLLKTFFTGGYFRVTLCNQTGRRNHLVHRLVAGAFLSNQNHKEEVNHIDGNKRNNSVENLEWTTRAENMQHAYNTSPRKYKGVIQFDKNGCQIKQWKSINMAAKEFKIHPIHICECCQGKRKTTGGYMWKYKEAV